MPHYYFHLDTPEGREMDTVGCQFPDMETAYLEACRAILEMGTEMLQGRKNPAGHQFCIHDEMGRQLLEVSFSEVMRPGPVPMQNDPLWSDIQAQFMRAHRLQAEAQKQTARFHQVLQRISAAAHS